jgi:hypothetical protein
MLLSSYKVSLVYEGGTSIDITDTVTNLSISESLFGNLEGFIEIVDGVGILDNAISNQTRVLVEFDYIKSRVSHTFYLDGVRSVDITTHLTKKTYVINFKAIDSLLNSMQLVAKSFKGRSSDIIKQIFDQHFDTKLKVLTDSITQGHYISPNVSPNRAIKQIQNQAYDSNISPFFLFQRLISSKFSFLTSLTQVEDQLTSATIATQIQNDETINKPFSNIGQPSNIVIHNDNDNQIEKISNGIYGKTIVNVDISNSTIGNEAYGATTTATSRSNLMRPDMFDIGKPLLNSDDHINICKMQTILNMLFSTRITAYGCQAIPNIGVGNKIKLKMQNHKQKQQESSKYSGNYIISKIIHNIVDNDYTQHIEVVRG